MAFSVATADSFNAFNIPRFMPSAEATSAVGTAKLFFKISLAESIALSVLKRKVVTEPELISNKTVKYFFCPPVAFGEGVAEWVAKGDIVIYYGSERNHSRIALMRLIPCATDSSLVILKFPRSPVLFT